MKILDFRFLKNFNFEFKNFLIFKKRIEWNQLNLETWEGIYSSYQQNVTQGWVYCGGLLC